MSPDTLGVRENTIPLFCVLSLQALPQDTPICQSSLISLDFPAWA